MATTFLYTGVNGSDRSQQIDTLMREHRDRALLIAPTVAYALRRRTDILLEGAAPGAWGMPVWEFKNFAVALLEAEGRPPRLLDNDERLWLLSGCLDQLRRENTLGNLAAVTETPGCIRHFLSVITQLKQAGIPPEIFRSRINAQHHPTDFDESTACIYEAYQEALQQANAYDVPGLFWAVELCCNQQRPRVLQGITTLVFDGFDDFTPSQIRVIKALSAHVDQLVVGLNHDTQPDRQDLFALTARTATRIREEFDAELRHATTPAPTSYSQFAARHSFWRDPPPEKTGLENNIRLMACNDATHEVECIARKVNDVLIAGKCTPDSVAVVYRNLEEIADTVHQVFQEFGIPLRLKQEAALQQSSIGRFLLRLFEVWDKWSPDAVADVISAPWWMAYNDAGAAEAIERVIRELQLLPGRDQWDKRLDAARTTLNENEINPEYRPLQWLSDPLATVEAIQHSVNAIDALEKAFPRNGTLCEFALAVDSWLDTWMQQDCLQYFSVEADRLREHSAVHALRALLEKLGEQDTGETITRELFLNRFREALKMGRFPRPDTSDGVLCCDVLSLRNLSVDHVFFGGLNEGIVPAPPQGNAVYPENDLERLRRMGIRLEGKQEHADRERMLFYHVVSAARKSLTLSWRLLKDTGREASPSPFYTELLDLFSDTPSVLEPIPVADSFIADAHTVASLRDVHNAVFLRYPALRSNPEFDRVQHMVAIENRRFSAEPCDAFDGVLSDATLRARNQHEYGEQHEYSVNQLESYITCPYQFFAERMLGIEALERPVEEFDARIRGLILHDVLEMLHRSYRGLAVPEIPEEVTEQLEGWIDAAFDRHGWKSGTAPAGLLLAERRRMVTVLQRYLDIERITQQDRWKPQYFEAAFGHRAGKGDHDLSNQAPYILESDAGPIRFTGRIDRVDLNAEGTQARIVDYKSSMPPTPKAMKEGESLQLTVYAWALENVLAPKIPCQAAHYIEVGKQQTKGDPNREGLGKGGSKPWSALRETAARERIAKSVGGIRAGHFPPYRNSKTACTYCACKKACRYQENRMQQKQADQG